MRAACGKCLQWWYTRCLLGALALILHLHIPVDDAFCVRAIGAGDGFVYGGFQVWFRVTVVHVGLVDADT